MAELIHHTTPAHVGAWLHDNEFGWRARIGVINPSAAITFEHEWARMLPKGVSFHVTRLLLERLTIEALDAMAARASEAAQLLKTSHVDVLCYGCTIGSLHRGRAGEQKLATRLKAAVSLPTVMMAESAVDALRSFGAQRIAVANPYPAEINQRIRKYLEECGFDVAIIESIPVTESWDVTKLKPQDVADLATRALKKAGTVDALFLSCGNMRTVDVIPRIEAETGIRTVSSNQAMLWRTLQVIDYHESLPGFGALLERQA